MGLFISSNKTRLPLQEAQTLVEVAFKSIHQRLNPGTVFVPCLSDYPSSLQEKGATFITLESGGKLRGCVGTIKAENPLVVDVAKNAHAAAFEDPRYSPLTPQQLSGLEILISILSSLELVYFSSEDELLSKIRPGVDGLVLSHGWNVGVFLPVVWEDEPDPRDFLTSLKEKAGLAADFWSDKIRVQRFTVESISAIFR